MQYAFQIDGSLSPVKGAPAGHFCEFQINTEPDDPDMPGLEDVGPDPLGPFEDEDDDMDDEDVPNPGKDEDDEMDDDVPDPGKDGNGDDKIHDINIDGEDPESDDYSTDFDNTRYATASTRFTTNFDTTPDIRPGKEQEAPLQIHAVLALADIKELLSPKRRNHLGEELPGHTDPGFDVFKHSRMEGMRSLLAFYTNPKSATFDKWGPSSCQAAISFDRGRYCARQLRFLTRQFIRDRTLLPINPYGSWNESMLVDEDLVNDINLYLQELGDAITAKKLADFLSREDVKSKHGITRTISERTACRYLQTLGYRWQAAKKGQYVDGHEREDVVSYREHHFLPEWKALQDRMQNWTTENLPEFGPHLSIHRVIVWFHDETIFYAHDRRKRLWIHKDAPAKPYAKGDGASLMIAHYVSADFGWLVCGNSSAQRILKPGKNRDGYFSSDDIIRDAEVRFSSVLDPFSQNRELNQQRTARTGTELE
jgi:hypothetical protein